MSVRLLYVEDDDDLRRLICLMLVNEGYEVAAVSNAEDAIVEPAPAQQNAEAIIVRL